MVSIIKDIPSILTLLQNRENTPERQEKKMILKYDDKLLLLMYLDNSFAI